MVDVKSFASNLLFDLARNSSAPRPTRLAAYFELVARNDDRANHPDLFDLRPKDTQVVEKIKVVEKEVKVPTSGPPAASVTTANLMRAEELLHEAEAIIHDHDTGK